MIHEIYKEKYFKKYNKLIQNKKKLIKKAEKIIAISENTKKDIIKYYNIPEKKIDVVYLGTSLYENKSKKIDWLPEKYILYVGRRGGYKNFNKMIKVIYKILKEENISLVCAGGGKFKNKELKMFDELSIKDNLFQINVNDEELTYLYKNAGCLVFPSLYEGFGLPVIEALKLGCPVVSSDRGSLPEIGKEACLYFDPEKRDSILHSVTKVLFSRKERKNLINKGEKLSKKYDWKICTQKTLQIYKKII